MKIFITLAGGWDKSIDEIPSPSVLTEAELPAAIDEMIDMMVDDPGVLDEGAENIYPLVNVTSGGEQTEMSKRAHELIKQLRDADLLDVDNPQLEKPWIDLCILMKEYLTETGSLEALQFWDCYEGSFYGIFAKEV